MLRNQEVNQFAVDEAIRMRLERDAALASAEKWRRIAKSGSRSMLSVGTVLGVFVLGLVAAVVLWLRAAAAAQGAC